MQQRAFETSGEPREKKLLDRVRDLIRRRHYSYRTEKTYVDWIIRYIRFHGLRHPGELGGAGVEAFLTHLARDRHVAPSTQNQALSALLFLYHDVLDIDFERRQLMVREPKGQRDRITLLPTSLVDRLRAQVERVRILHDTDLAAGFGATRHERPRTSACRFRPDVAVARSGGGG